jgi:hypothetical protein
MPTPTTATHGERRMDCRRLAESEHAALHGKRLSRDTAWAMLQESLKAFIRRGYARFNQAEREPVDGQEPARAQTAPL